MKVGIHLSCVVSSIVSFASAAPAAASPTEKPVESTARVKEQQQLLSNLWTFASLNYLYCDVIGLMDSKIARQYQEGKVGSVKIDEPFLVAGTVLMQVPLSMVFLSTALEPRASRIANVSAGAFMTAVQTATLFIGRPTSYYLVSSGLEIATTSFITAYALFAMKPPPVAPAVEVKEGGMLLKATVRF